MTSRKLIGLSAALLLLPGLRAAASDDGGVAGAPVAMPSATVATPAEAAASSATANPTCLTSQAGWQSRPLPPQSGLFTAQFDAAPGAANMEAVAGLSQGSPSEEAALAAAVRFSPEGTIEALSGAKYTPSTITYAAGANYHFRLVVDPGSHSYSVYVSSAGAPEQVLGAGLALRSELPILNTLSWNAQGGAVTTCNAWAAAAPPPAPSIMITFPAPGATVAGGVNVLARVTGSTAIAAVQFQLDGTNVGPEVTASPFAMAWNTAQASDGPHLLGAVVRDAVGASSSAVAVPVVVANAPPTVSSVTATNSDSGGAIVSWSTDRPADSQLVYGPTTAYGSTTPLDPSTVTAHSMTLLILAPGTLYHFRIRSRDGGGVLAVSPDFTFTSPGDASSVALATGAAVLSAGPSGARSAQKFLTPALADGINDAATFGPDATEVSIFNTRGRQVFHATQQGGPIVWDCKAGNGRVVESGVYIARIRTSGSETLYQSFAVAK